MKQGDRRYTVHWHQAGQARPYAPLIHDFTLKIEWIAYKKRETGEALEWEPNDLSDYLVDKAAKAVGYSWVEKGQGDWASPFLTSRTKVGPGQWRFVIREECTD